MLQYAKNVRRKKYSFFSWNWNWQYSLNSFLKISWIPNQNWLRPFIWFDNDWFLLSLLLNELNSATTFTTKPTHNRQQYFILYIDLSPPAKPMTFLTVEPMENSSSERTNSLESKRKLFATWYHQSQTNTYSCTFF